MACQSLRYEENLESDYNQIVNLMSNKYKCAVPAFVFWHYGLFKKCVICQAVFFFAVGLCFGDDADAGIYFQKALKEADSGEFDAALFDYSKVIDLDPVNEPAYVNRGNIENHQGNLDGAFADYNKAIELEPTEASAWFDRGNLKYAKKDLAGALADFNKAIALNPALVMVYSSRGLVKEAQGDHSGAMADYNKAIALDPGQAGVYNDRGVLKQQFGDFDGALADYDQAVKLDPQNGLFYNNRAGLKLAKGNTAGARDDLEKSLDSKSVLPAEANRLRERLEAATHKLDDSLADLNRAKIIDPNDANIFVDLGRYKRSRGDLSGALADYNEAISINSNDAAAYYFRGMTKGLSGDNEGAIVDFDKAIGLNPKNAGAYRTRAFAEWALGEDNAAMSDVDQAIAIAPKYAPLYSSRGWLRYSQQDFDDALADFRKSCQLDPWYSQDNSRFCIWLIQAREGHEAQATADLQTYLQSRKPHGTNDWQLKVADYLTGTLSEAGLLNAAGDPNPKTNSVRHAMAWFYAASKRFIEGDLVTSKSDFEKCLATNEKDIGEYQSAAAELKYLAQNHPIQKSSF